jgi:hypothetical protein
MVECSIGLPPAAEMQAAIALFGSGPEARQIRRARQRLLDALIEHRIIVATGLVAQGTANPTFRDASARPVGTLI